ncbi:hypothetical protein PspLS_10488 [Pyricularia sp. CBS 133598]|nr:hypothetical protein PspLS_10488 [Pyricularia sp. CBS 133598]
MNGRERILDVWKAMISEVDHRFLVKKRCLSPHALYWLLLGLYGLLE